MTSGDACGRSQVAQALDANKFNPVSNVVPDPHIVLAISKKRKKIGAKMVGGGRGGGIYLIYVCKCNILHSHEIATLEKRAPLQLSNSLVVLTCLF